MVSTELLNTPWNPASWVESHLCCLVGHPHRLRIILFAIAATEPWWLLLSIEFVQQWSYTLLKWTRASSHVSSGDYWSICCYNILLANTIISNRMGSPETGWCILYRLGYQWHNRQSGWLRSFFKCNKESEQQKYNNTLRQRWVQLYGQGFRLTRF